MIPALPKNPKVDDLLPVLVAVDQRLGQVAERLDELASLVISQDAEIRRLKAEVFRLRGKQGRAS